MSPAKSGRSSWFLVLGAVLLFGSLFWLKHRKTLAQRTFPIKILLGSMEGLGTGSEVRLDGYPIGRIEQVEIRTEGVRYEFLVTASVQEGVPLFYGTVGRLESPGLGGALISLVPPPVEKRREILQAGSLIVGERGTTTSDVVRHADRLVRDMDDTFLALRQQIEAMQPGRAFSEARLRSWAESTSRSLAHLEAAGREAKELLQHTDRSLDTLDDTLKAARGSAQAVEGALKADPARLERILASADQGLAELKGLAASARGTLDQASPKVSADLASLQSALDSLRELLELLKAKPSRVLYGRTSEEEQRKAKEAVKERK